VTAEVVDLPKLLEGIVCSIFGYRKEGYVDL